MAKADIKIEMPVTASIIGFLQGNRIHEREDILLSPTVEQLDQMASAGALPAPPIACMKLRRAYTYGRSRTFDQRDVDEKIEEIALIHRAGNPQGPRHANGADASAMNAQDAAKMLRFVTSCCDLDGTVNPAASFADVTALLQAAGLSPTQAFGEIRPR